MREPSETGVTNSPIMRSKHIRPTALSPPIRHVIVLFATSALSGMFQQLLDTLELRPILSCHLDTQVKT